MPEQSDLRDEEIMLSMGAVLSIWWLIWWRTVILLVVGGMIVVFIAGIILGLLEVDDLQGHSNVVINVFSAIWAPIVSVWVIHMAFRKRYARTGFRIALVPLDETKSRIGVDTISETEKRQN
jgi:hypothetical protein